MTAWRPWAAFAGCVAIWSGTWLAIRAGAPPEAPIGNGALRATLAACILLAVALLAKARRPGWTEVRRLALAGTVFIGVNFALVYVAAGRVPPSMAALLYATVPIQSAVLGPLLVGSERFEWRVIAGSLAGAAGVVVALGGVELSLTVGTSFVLLGATASAVGAALVRRSPGTHPLWTNVICNAAGGSVLWVASAALERSSPVPSGAAAWAGFAYLVLGGSVVAFLLYFVLLQHWTTARAAYTSVAASMGAMALGVATGDSLRTPLVVGAGLVLAGAVIALRRQAPAAGAATATHVAVAAKPLAESER